MKVAIIYPNLEGSPQSLDMGVAYLATYLDERTDHSVKIIDPTFHKRHWESYIKKEIKDFKPDVVGISIVSLFFGYARKIARQIKDYHDVPIVVGGFQAMMAPEETMETEEFDVLCTGEGEYTLTEYLKALENKEDLRSVRGIWFRENGKIIKNENREYNSDLDALPIPNYELFDDIDKYLYYLQRLYIIGTRGCPYSCTFCAESILGKINPGKRFRERNPRKYVAEIHYLYEKYRDRGMKLAHIYDAVFTFNDQWLNDWADEYKKRGLNKELPYSSFLKADDHNASDEKLKILADTGCLQVRIGIESGDDDIRDNILNKRGSKDNEIMAIIDKCNKYGFIVKTYSILGIPGDTKESMRKTYNFCKTPLVHVPLFFSYTPLPNTPLAQKVSIMNESKNAQTMYSFHFSKGARNKGVSKFHVPGFILKTYVRYGLRLIGNTFLFNPVKFIPYLLSRIFYGFTFGCPLMLSTGYALISPVFWPNLSKGIRRRWEKRNP